MDFAHLTELELLFLKALALMASACLVAPAFRRLGLGTVLGYLVAGIAVKLVFAESFTEHPEELLHFSEFGVVLFLFVIGLELKPATLWQMRSDIFGLGLAQMLACGAALSLLASPFVPGPGAAAVVGLGLALSSTAIVMRQLDERRERTSPHGRKAFSILLFQDLSIVPLLLLVLLLTPSAGPMGLAEGAARVGAGLAAIAVLVLVGRYLLTPVFHAVARSRMPELMTASALAVVIGAAMLVDLVGMSYAMGAFIAGVMLAESAYRHEMEANIEPFRGLFLGLFFMAVGLSLDLETVASRWLLVLVAAPVAMLAKGLAIFAVSRAFGIPPATARRVAFALPQLGEFGFVLFAAAASAGLLDPATASTLVAIVSVSMALSPVALALEPLVAGREVRETLDEDFAGAGHQAVLIGFGRFGQIVAQVLFANEVDATILDDDADRIREARSFGFRVHFGDGSRRDVLRAAGAGHARVIVVCTDDPATTDRCVALVQAEFPGAVLGARSFDRRHSIRLRRAGVDFCVRETFESGLAMGVQVLKALGASEEDAQEAVADVRRLDLARLEQQIAGSDGRDLMRVRPEPLRRT